MGTAAETADAVEAAATADAPPRGTAADPRRPRCCEENLLGEGKRWA
jgi:hypothetical protein